jgi:hypothetical protein
MVGPRAGELKRLVAEAWGQDADTQAIEALIEDADVDGDGEVSWDEFCEMLSRCRGQIGMHEVAHVLPASRGSHDGEPAPGTKVSLTRHSCSLSRKSLDTIHSPGPHLPRPPGHQDGRTRA